MSLIESLNRRVAGISPDLGVRLSWMRYRRGAAGLRLIDAIVRRGDRVVDVGAAGGLYAARMSQLVGRRGHVHAFEPNPAQFAEVEALAARRRNVSAHRLALSDRAGTAELHVPVLGDEQRPGLGSLGVPAARATIDHRTVTVALERLDAVLGEGSPPIAFVKCDVEGHERQVLLGAEETLRRSRPALLVEIEQRHQDEPIQTTFDYLAGLGYTGHALAGGGLLALERFDVERDQLAHLDEAFAEIPGPGYVNDFLFVAPGTDMAPLEAAARPS